MSMDLLFYTIAGILILLGLAGVILPALPGLPFVFIGFFLIAWTDKFQHISGLSLWVLGALTIFSLILDFFASLLGAKRVGASPKALWGSFIGGIVGLFFIPIGLFLGPFVGAVVGELWHSPELSKATKVGLATTLGVVIGMALKLAIAILMVGYFVMAWFL